MAKKPYKNPNYTPRIHWECGLNHRFSYWTITASAPIPGDDELCAFNEYTLPGIKVGKQGLHSCLEEIVRDAEISLSYKYNSLVHKHAAKNKHAQAALNTITEWQDKHEQSETN